jgi:2-polyprenyl-3-methyl-5-hydroxy-6-metoxy-1,4-benzoquinol methylase
MGKAALEARLSDTHYSAESEFERSSKKMMRAMVPASPVLRILDIGCGTGLNASFLKAAGHTVVGVDLSPVAIDRFREKDFEGFVCDVETQGIPSPDASFDLVYASEVIEHCADTAAFLNEVFRVLKPGGKAVVSTPNSAFWAFRILGILGRTASEYQHPGHVRFFSKRSLRRCVEAAGFEVTTTSARHMYLLLGGFADLLSPLLSALGFERENRFATGGHFWQLSRFAPKASGLWADTLFFVATKPPATP